MREFRRKESHWKHYTLLIILLSHTVLGSPALNAVGASNGSSTITNSNVSTSSPSEKSQDTVLLEESAFGSGSISDPDANSTVSDATNNQGSREKRTLYETWKKAKKIKLISLGEASASAVKQVGKSIFKNIATLGIKAIIFNFLYSKINQVLDFKTRMLNNLEQKNREQNAQLLGIGVESTSSEKSAPAAAGSNADGADSQIPEFNPDKITLAIPDALFSPSFSLANGISQVIGTLVQNKANRIARMFEALKPFLRSSVGVNSKTRPSRNDFSDDFDDNNLSAAERKRFSATNGINDDDSADDTPIKTSYVALTGR